jgi:hypothetical protein
MFSRHVYDGNEVVELLGSGKVQCMHCPMFFKFIASEEAVEEIISSTGMQPVLKQAERVDDLNRLISRDSEWWVPVGNFSPDRVIGVSYEGEDYHYESAFRILIQKGDTIYYITSGHFNPEHYSKDNA